MDHDGRPEHVFWRAKDKLFIDDIDLPILPDWYKRQAFANDVLSMFNNSPPLGGRRNLIPLSQQLSFRPDLFVLEEWAEVQRFHALFQNTLLWDMLMKHDDYDLFDKAKYVINFMSARTHLEGFDYDAYLADVLRKILEDANNPYSQMCQMMGRGPKPGEAHKHIYYLQKAQELEELIRKLMMKYEPMSRVDIKIKESHEPADDTRPQQIKHYTDLPHVFPSQLGLPDEIFWLRVAFKDLDKLQHLIVEKKPRKFVMLLDTSGSMDGGRELYATASTIALLKQTARSGNINKAIVIPFDSQPHKPFEGSVDEVIDKLMETPFSGGGTKIDKALRKAEEDYDPDEIVIVTDGEDQVSYKPKALVHTVFVGQKDYYDKGLLEISRTFEQVDVKRR